MSKNVKINVPKEHPILRNIFMCIFCMLIVAPIIVALIGKAVDYKESKSAVKSEETVGQVLEYTLITDSEGNTKEFNTTVVYNIAGVNYTKIFNTNYYIADKGQFIKMYYEKGNPYSVSVTRRENKFGLKERTDIYSLLCMLMVIFFTYNAYQDLIKANERKLMWAQTQVMLQTGAPGLSALQNNSMLNNGMNNIGGISNNMTPKW